MFRRAIEGKLAGGPRPRMPNKPLSQVSRSIVDEWIRRAKRDGIRSVICLLDESQLGLYQNLPRDLMSYYRASGLQTHSGSQLPALSTFHISVKESLESISAAEKAGLDPLQCRNRPYREGRFLHQARVEQVKTRQ